MNASRHAWLSSKPLHQNNVHERCNLGARHRWAIESGFLDEKRHGHSYEHCYSINWKAMKGYHYLMRLAQTLNVIAHYSSALIKSVRSLGVRGFIEFLRESPSRSADSTRYPCASALRRHPKSVSTNLNGRFPARPI